MSDKGVPCKKCGKLPYLHKYCGDNGSSFNGVMWRIACGTPGCNNETETLKSYAIVESQWEAANQPSKPTANSAAA